MQQSQPHLEILSRNRVNRSTILVAVIPVSLFSGVLIYALWSFLWLLAYGALVLLSISSLYLVLILAIDIYRRVLHARFIYNNEHGMVDAASGRVYPLALPAPSPVTVIEEKPEDEELNRAKVLLFKDIGYSIQRIADETGIKPWKVQKWTSDYEKAKKAKQTR